jgi:hypothetical protein
VLSLGSVTRFLSPPPAAFPAPLPSSVSITAPRSELSFRFGLVFSLLHVGRLKAAPKPSLGKQAAAKEPAVPQVRATLTQNSFARPILPVSDSCSPPPASSARLFGFAEFPVSLCSCALPTPLDLSSWSRPLPLRRYCSQFAFRSVDSTRGRFAARISVSVVASGAPLGFWSCLVLRLLCVSTSLLPER